MPRSRPPWFDVTLNVILWVCDSCPSHHPETRALNASFYHSSVLEHRCFEDIHSVLLIRK